MAAMKCLIFFLYIVGIYSQVCPPLRYCQDDITAQLEINEIYFFDTSLAPDYCPPCSITFNLNNPNKTKMIGYAASRIFIHEKNLYPYPTIYYFDETAIPIAVIASYTIGFVIYEKEGRKCPLESISSEKPFKFTDIKQVLYLENGIDEDNTIVSPCKWQFTAPNGYGFKIVVNTFEFDADTQLLIKNGTEILVNERSVILHHPIYNSDDYIQIFLSNQQKYLRFNATVSIVKQEVIIEDVTCFSDSSTTPNTITWGTMPDLSLRSNNERCRYQLSILPNAQIRINYAWHIMGDSGDYTGYYDTDNNGNLVKYFTEEDPEYPFYYLYGYKNDSIRNITWEYFSDGSIPGYGFQMIFTITECGKTNQQLFCGSAVTAACANVEYVFTLHPCLTEYFQFDFTGIITGGSHTSDYYEVYSNGTLVYQLQDPNPCSILNVVVLHSRAENIFKFQATLIETFGFFTLPYFITKANAYVKLSFENPTYIMDATPYPKVVFEISDDLAPYNFSTEVNRNRGGEIYFWTDETLTMQVPSKCTAINQELTNFDTCTIKNHKTFVVYSVGYINLYPYTAVQISNNQKCLFERSIIHVTEEFVNSEKIVSFISRPNIPCSIILMVGIPNPDYLTEITKVWTTSAKENVKIFGGNFQNTTIAEFNSKSQNTWKNLTLNSYVYTIEIPKNSSIFIIVSVT